jgi:hypothetical protein
MSHKRGCCRDSPGTRRRNAVEDHWEPSPFGSAYSEWGRSETHRLSGGGVPAGKIDRLLVQDAVGQQKSATGLCGDPVRDTNFAVLKAKLCGQPKTTDCADADSGEMGLD